MGLQSSWNCDGRYEAIEKTFTLNLVTIVIVIRVKASGNCYIPNPAQALDSYAFSLLILISSPSVIGGVAAA